MSLLLEMPVLFKIRSSQLFYILGNIVAYHTSHNMCCNTQKMLCNEFKLSGVAFILIIIPDF